MGLQRGIARWTFTGSRLCPQPSRFRLPERRPRELCGRFAERSRLPTQSLAPRVHTGVKSACRRAANRLVEEALRGGGIMRRTEVLRVLKLWAFDDNSRRANVIPIDSAFVPSDTFGLVGGTAGVKVSSLTMIL